MICLPRLLACVAFMLYNAMVFYWLLHKLSLASSNFLPTFSGLEKQHLYVR